MLLDYVFMNNAALDIFVCHWVNKNVSILLVPIFGVELLRHKERICSALVDSRSR
jgi:hypothetical protein